MEREQVLAVSLNPTFQRTLVLESFREDTVLRSREYYHDVAGKGLNTARILTQLGHSAVHLTHVGGPLSQHYLEENRREGLRIAYVETDTPIRTCCTIISRKDNTTTELVEEPVGVPEGTEKRILELFHEELSRSALLIISGSLSPGYSADLYPGMVSAAGEKGIPVILDIRGPMLFEALQYRPTIINPNYDEFVQTFFPGAQPGDRLESLIDKKMLELYRAYGILSVITRGADPVRYVDNGRIRTMDVRPVTPVNTVGCGDAFTAGLASGILNGGDMSGIVRKGQECAERNVLQIRPGRILPQHSTSHTFDNY